jgi:A/G-specific adenine glycosylase
MNPRLSQTEIEKFQNKVYEHYINNKRNLPWRKTTDPYKIVVSEIMLQQTQVTRVVKKFNEFINEFPDFASLHTAPLDKVLALWQGLGFNRRAIALKKISELVIDRYGGILPKDPKILKKFPGIGKATASSIAVYAFNTPEIFIETNIRTVFIHDFFKDKTEIKDEEILPLVEQTLDEKNPSKWYNALMDYGVYLKKTNKNPGRKSAHYIKQKSFKGSDREYRGKILKILLKQGYSNNGLLNKLKITQTRLNKLLDALVKEGFILRKNDKYYIVSK